MILIKKKSFVFKTTNPVKSVKENNTFVKDIAKILDMKIISGPHSKYINDKGNEGVSSVTIIKTSHICVHSWDKIAPGLVHLDIFSCKNFKVINVIKFLKERFYVIGKIVTK
jgi:S-adenosylmethionine/arginine decarboxylase-like enzyme